MKITKITSILLALCFFSVFYAMEPEKKKRRTKSLSSAAKKVETSLFDAIKKGDENLVKLLVGIGADVNASQSDGATWLHIAVYYGHEAIVKLLLERGADINAAPTAGPNAGGTPLLLAVCQNHEAIVTLLHERGADVNGRFGSTLSTPLHVAVEKGNEAVVKLLVDGGADVNASESDGTTPLHIAALKGDAVLAKLLLDRGAEVNSAPNDGPNAGITPLYAAVSQAHVELVELLLVRGANVDNTIFTQSSAKHSILGMPVIKTKNFNAKTSAQLLFRLIESGAVIPDILLDTIRALFDPLVYAAIFSSPIELESMLTTCNYDSHNTEQLQKLGQALRFAASRGRQEVVNLFLAKGAPADSALYRVTSILMQSAGMLNADYKAIFTVLVKSIGDLKQKQIILSKLLERAVFNRNIAVAQLLLEHDAPIKQALVALDQLLALPQAAQARIKLINLRKFLVPRASLIELLLCTDQPGVRKTIIQEQSKIPEKLQAQSKVREKSQEQDKVLLDRIASLAAHETNRYFATVITGSIDEVKALLKAGIDPNIANAQGKTALWIAAERGDTSMVELLLSNDKVIADPPNAKTGQTLLNALSKIPARAAIADIIKSKASQLPLPSECSCQ